mmetsp:Transcript_10309/g.17097  ORF Transcript_10309/g.17097 Transcript_10309/m.17097 type:complete len:214 (-) Transcript_10309:433-1074(-)|eukprot:CAMPEP_0119007738 /NCGR_PEP_ID=MMETSP1176-20130426/3215_1 /TAXON_ID=265551 /ORGANISM="Synedropsis recta cf, Strain CCMP1620" /LENGTH=213 /DNA_ID=CAMNT_0006959939 /DNA_START=33 /DNA_END=674 /DNA_ORIENTATION=+
MSMTPQKNDGRPKLTARSHSTGHDISTSMRIKFQRQSLLNRGLNGALRESTKKRVAFDVTELREFPMILGDNPSVLEGPPVTIDWDFNVQTHFVLQVDTFERMRGNSRRSYSDLRLSKAIRVDRLLKGGTTQKEIVQAIRQVRKDQHNRVVSAQIQPGVESMHKAVENARIGFKKIILFKKSKYEKKLERACRKKPDKSIAQPDQSPIAPRSA